MGRRYNPYGSFVGHTYVCGIGIYNCRRHTGICVLFADNPECRYKRCVGRGNGKCRRHGSGPSTSRQFLPRHGRKYGNGRKTEIEIDSLRISCRTCSRHLLSWRISDLLFVPVIYCVSGCTAGLYTTKGRTTKSVLLSGRGDSNTRPLRPERSALANCATSRKKAATFVAAFFCREEVTRTPDPHVPNVVR